MEIDKVMFAKRICILEKYRDSLAEELGEYTKELNEEVRKSYEELDNCFKKVYSAEAKALTEKR